MPEVRILTYDGKDGELRLMFKLDNKTMVFHITEASKTTWNWAKWKNLDTSIKQGVVRRLPPIKKPDAYVGQRVYTRPPDEEANHRNAYDTATNTSEKTIS